jgi:hypothetical protein
MGRRLRDEYPETWLVFQRGARPRVVTTEEDARACHELGHEVWYVSGTRREYFDASPQDPAR